MYEYNFMGLVNSINGRLNEVPLTESNFVFARGWYVQAKEAVNAAIQHIAHQEFQWPFYYEQEDLPLVVGQSRYSLPDEAESVKMDSFRLIAGHNITNRAHYLKEQDYEDLLQNNQVIDTDVLEANVGRPNSVFRYPSMDFGVHPAPNDEYTMRYEWYALPEELVAVEDIPRLPKQWRHVLINGAMMYAYMFRGDPESSALMQTIFDNDIKRMRKVYENRYVRVRGGQRKG